MSGSNAVQVRLDDDEIDALDSYRRTHKSPPSRARAAHDLIRIAMEQARSGGDADGADSISQ
jgi:hypothetical protein